MTKFLLRAQLRAVLPNGVLLHASTVVVNDLACVFLAPSGGGKSSLRRSLTLFNGDFAAISDDSVIISEGTDGVIRCLPCASLKQIAGTELIKGAPLDRFFFLEKGLPQMKRSVSREYAFYRAVRTSSILALGTISRAEQIMAYSFLKKLFCSFYSYILRWDIDNDPAEMIE
jgi:serine kinase of HPr protein (carbohydrate metabolism regulator)